jgi:DNA-binding MarR family transcriptional regulator
MMIKHQSGAHTRGSCNCGALRRASRRISQLYDATLAPSGVKTTQFAILAELERSSGADAVTMCKLAAAMIMDRSTLGHNLRPLQRDRLVMMRLAEDDRRKRYVELTARGKVVLKHAHSLWRLAEEEYERVLGKRPAAKLRAVLHGIATNNEFDRGP